MKKYRVFIGLTEIAGYYSNLKNGFDQLGIKCEHINLNSNPFKYAKNQSKLSKFFDYLRDNKEAYAKEYGITRNFANKIKFRFWRNIFDLSKNLLFLYALISYDVFIFGFRTSFFEDKKDLGILKFFGKKIIYVFNGSDSRPPYLNGAYFDFPDEKIADMVKIWKDDISIINKYADFIVDHPPTSHFHQKPVIQFLKIGIPFYLPDYKEEIPDQESGTIKIVHAPSRPKEKGTETIRKVLQELREDGYNIELIELINKPNSEVIRALKQCDFVIDELYSDTAMAGLATEAAWFGKPSITRGYEINKAVSLIKEEEIPPALFGSPDTLKEDVLKLIEDENFRINLGQKAKEFVRSQWSSVQVAQKYIKIINNDVPEDWYFNPNQIDFVHGWGLNIQQRNNLVNRIVNKYGINALGIDNKPDFEQLLVKVVSSEPEKVSQQS
jgi:glycosyltransferase involved in cell wall biosynthesis